MIHGLVHVRRRQPEHLLWTCHLGAVLVGAGLITGSALPVAVGVEWLCLGNILWAVELALGGEFMPTSLLTHVGALAAGLAGLRALGVPPGSWKAAAVGVAALYVVTWFATPSRSRVNLVHGVRRGLERVFPSYPVYVALAFAACVAVFAGVERLLRAW